MRRLLILIAFLPLILAAQLQLNVAPVGGQETLVTGAYDMGSVAVADAASVRFRIRNVGSASITLTSLFLNGSGFSMSGAPSLPYIVAPGVNVDFTVRFSPPNFGSYAATLQLNSTSFVFRGSGLPGAAVRVNGQDLPSDGSIDFGRVQRGNTSTVTVQLINSTTQPVSIRSVSVAGTGFTLAKGNPAPLTLAASQTGSFEILFTSSGAAIFTGTLTVDSRNFKLTASGFEPNLPRPTIILSNSALRSGEQGKVSIQLASASAAIAKGTLRMQLQPAGTIRDNDSGAQFVSGARTVSFDVAVGDTTVKLSGGDSIVFQTGTTAGTIVFVVEAGGFTEQASLTVAPEAVRLDKATAVRNGSSLEVQLTGFDNTHSLSEMSFTFYSNGQPMANMPIRVPVNTDFDKWWTTSTLGGIFGMKAAFQVNGDATKITAVDAQLTNTSGTTSTQRLTF